MTSDKNSDAALAERCREWVEGVCDPVSETDACRYARNHSCTIDAAWVALNAEYRDEVLTSLLKLITGEIERAQRQG